MSDVESRVAALERAVAALQQDQARAGPSESTEGHGPSSGDGGTDAGDRFWMLEGLRARHPAGAVGFAGHVCVAAGEAHWQWGRDPQDLLSQDWDDAATVLAALGHPVRLQLLRLVLTGTSTTSALTEAEGLGTTGQLHHHLRALVAAGWLASAGRGRYEVPAQRIVPLLVVLTATLPA